MTLRPIALVSALGLAFGLAGCGATPPQPPLAQAGDIGGSTGGISTACGLAYQVTAFPGDHRRDLATLEASASSAALRLSRVYQRNREWDFQGETVNQIATQSIDELNSCGLHQAAAVLSRALARR